MSVTVPPFEFIEKSLIANVEALRCLLAVPAGLFQGFPYKPALRVLRCSGPD